MIQKGQEADILLPYLNNTTVFKVTASSAALRFRCNRWHFWNLSAFPRPVGPKRFPSTETKLHGVERKLCC